MLKKKYKRGSIFVSFEERALKHMPSIRNNVAYSVNINRLSSNRLNVIPVQNIHTNEKKALDS